MVLIFSFMISEFCSYLKKFTYDEILKFPMLFTRIFIVSFFFFFFPVFLGPQVPKLEIELEPQPPAYTRAIATPDLSCTRDLHPSLQQCRIL